MEERSGAAQSVEGETLQVESGTRHWRGQWNFRVLSGQPDWTSISEGATIGIFFNYEKKSNSNLSADFRTIGLFLFSLVKVLPNKTVGQA